MDRAPSIADLPAIMRFTGLFTQVLGEVVVALLKETNGNVPEHVKRLVHDRLPALSEAALAVPENFSALRGFDLFLALIPPPEEPPPSD